MVRTSLLLALVACTHAPARTPAPARGTLGLTYLGVAGWQIEGAGVTVLTDPYLSRPDLEQPMSPDLAAIAKHVPARADLIVVGHSHVDHLLDAPEAAKRTGAQLMGSVSTARFAAASGLPAEQIIPIKGGEDYAFGAYSVRVIPSLHSALSDKHTMGTDIAADVRVPVTFDELGEGGTFAYLIRLAGQQVLVFDTANFIERELVGVRPDIVLMAPGLRDEIHDYTCRLMHVLGDPPVVIATHFDAWRAPPVDGPPTDDLRAFVDEVKRCAPGTRVIVPSHFVRFEI